MRQDQCEQGAHEDEVARIGMHVPRVSTLRNEKRYQMNQVNKIQEVKLHGNRQSQWCCDQADTMDALPFNEHAEEMVLRLKLTLT